MHHSNIHYIDKVDVAPTEHLPPKDSPGLFNIRVLHREGSSWQHFHRVHIPSTVQSLFQGGQVRAFDLEFLPRNSVASKALAGPPKYAVLGVELSSGERISCIPAVFVTKFRSRLLGAALLTTVGVGLALTSFAWLGGLLVGMSTHLVRTALSFPRRAF